MDLKDLKSRPNQNIDYIFDKQELKKMTIVNSLIKEYLNIDYHLDLQFSAETLSLNVDGIINFKILAIDARDGKEFEYSDSVDWNEEYSFDQKLDDHQNLILDQKFNLLDYTLEQININIPINLSKNNGIISKVGSGWKLMSEQQFQEDFDDDTPDPRWNKLDEFVKKNN